MGDRCESSVIAIVPMKPFAEAKGRLANIMPRSDRLALTRMMFVRTLKVLKHARSVARTLVVSRDQGVLRIARANGAWSVLESKNGLNLALKQATRVAKANGADAVLIIPADLPKLSTKDVNCIIELGETPATVVISPALRDGGTNALVVNPSGMIDYAFGPDSFLEHKRRAEQAGARVEVYHSDDVAIDVDLPEDLLTVGNLFEKPAI